MRRQHKYRVQENRLVDPTHRGSKPMLDAKPESLLIALVCSDAAEGFDDLSVNHYIPPFARSC
jgi:hypothetical protein